jgi:hypothetical protein
MSFGTIGVGRLIIMEKFAGFISVGFEYRRPLGARCVAAGVSIHLSTSDDYKFENAVAWPEADYSGAVERGVRDGLRDSGYDPDLGVRVLLKSIEYDLVDSSEHTFYVAAKCAAKALAEILR